MGAARAAAAAASGARRQGPYGASARRGLAQRRQVDGHQQFVRPCQGDDGRHAGCDACLAMAVGGTRPAAAGQSRGALAGKDERPPAVHLAATATVPETVYDPVDAAQALLSVLQERFPEALVARYGDELATAGDAALEIVARRRGCLLPGGNPDWERAAGIVLGDFRAGRLGRITLELPPTGSEEGGASESDAANDDTAVEDEVP